MSTAEILAELPRLSLAELNQVQARLKELVGPAQSASPASSASTHPALGIWKERTDLPQDPIEASELLREQMMRRTDAAD